MPRAPKACGYYGCPVRVVGKTYCPDHAPAWRGSTRVVPSDWKKRKAQVMAAHNRVCHVCGHGAADEVDHVLNVAAGGTHDLANLAPIHGGYCPTCRQRCHKDKTAAEAARGRGAHRSKLKHPVERHPGLAHPGPGPFPAHHMCIRNVLRLFLCTVLGV